MPLTSWVDRHERDCVDQTNADNLGISFGWGLEYIGLGKWQGDPYRALAAWSDRTMDRLDVWYDHRGGPDPDYELMPVGRRLGGKVPAGWSTLRFRSACDGIDPVNRTVVARFAPGRRRRAPVVLVMPHWGARVDDYAPFARLLQGVGFSALILALPYHDVRKPGWMAYPRPVCCPNLGLNLAAVRQAVTDVRRAIDWVEARGAEPRIAGVSFGGAVTQVVATLDERIERSVVTFPCASLGRFVWGSGITRKIRRELASRLTLEQVERVWQPIHPISHLERLVGRDVRHTFITGSRDRVVTAEMSGDLIARYRQLGLKHRWHRYACGHYSIGRLPFSVRWSWDLVRALR